MLLLQTIKPHLNEECAIVYREFSAICGTNQAAAIMLSKFVYWSDVVHQVEPKRNGWFYKTAQHLREELGLTRRGYEKARSFLMEKGLLQYRRSGVHGKMHFCVNFGRLLEMIYEIKGMVAPKDVLKTQIDRDNYTLPKWIPLDKWNTYLDVYKDKKGKLPSNKQKSQLIKQLARLRGKFDLDVVMERSIVGGWIGFFSPEYQVATNHSANIQDKEAQAVMKAIQEHKKQASNGESLLPKCKPHTEKERQNAATHVNAMITLLRKRQKN